MADGVLLMSGSERDRAFLVRQAVEGRLGQREASERLGSAFVSSNGWCVPGGLGVTLALFRVSADDRRTGA
jgi:hypothetical protein